MGKTNIDQDKLYKMWKTYINDSSIFSKESFGRYAHTRVMKKGYAWPKLYYSGHKAYDILWQHIHKGYDEGIMKVK